MRKDYMLWALTFTLLLSGGCAWQQGSDGMAGGDKLLTYANTLGNDTQPTAAPGLITTEEAKAKALLHAGLIGVQVTFTENKLDYENGRQVYEVEFFTQEYEYDYEIDASTGEVVDFDYEKRTAGSSANSAKVPVNQGTDGAGNGTEASVSPASSNDGSTTAITPEQAKELVLSWIPGAAEQDIWKFKTEYDDGRTKYKGKIMFDSAEYEFEIDALTGKVIEFSYETAYNTLSPAGSSMITIEKAKELALAKVPGAQEQDILKAKMDYDNGHAEYEIKILFNNAKYEFEIDAYTGKIMELTYDAEYISVPVTAPVVSSAPTGTVTPGASYGSTTITAEEAKELALAKVPGATAQDILKFETDYDDGRTEYEGKIVYGGIEYEFEIDCCGVFHCWETETVGYYNHHSSGHHNSHHSTGSGTITAANAKALALAQVPGATARNIVEFETDYDDGRIEYEGKIIYNGMEYEFEIDGYSGAFRSWEAEPVDR